MVSYRETVQFQQSHLGATYKRGPAVTGVEVEAARKEVPRESMVGLEGLKGEARMGHRKDRDVGLFETHRTLSVKGRRRRGARLVLGTEKSSL